MNLVLFSVFFLRLVIADPQIIWLSQYSTESTNNLVSVETGGKLYLASNDVTSQLQKIRVQTGNNGFTLDQLLTGSGILLQTNQLTIISNIDAATAKSITGFLYTTTTAQANDNTFGVTVVNGPQDISKTEASTLVVLNTQFTTIHFPPADAPEKTTYVTNVAQHQNTDLNFHYGIPGANWKIPDNQFFENPQYTPIYGDWGKIVNYTRILFDSVEPIQVNLPYWYVTATGPFNMMLDSTYDNLNIHNTTNVRTTGAYVLTDRWKRDYFVNFVTDKTRNGTTGILLTIDLQDQVNVLFSSDSSTSNQSYNGQGFEHAQLITNMVSNTLHIHTDADYPGTLYFQYFVYPGSLLPTTVSPPTTPSTIPVTTSTVATTTKHSESYNVLFTLFVFACTLWKDQF